MPRRNKPNPSPSAKRKKRKKKRGPEDVTKNARVRREVLLGLVEGSSTLGAGVEVLAADLPSARTPGEVLT